MAARRKSSSRPPPAALRGGRVNQKARTRLSLVEAGLALLRSGTNPSISDVADAAGVSTATAYRYFTSPAALWEAVAEHTGAATVEEIFDGVSDDDARERVAALIAAVGGRYYEHEALFRTALLSLLSRGAGDDDARGDGRVARPSGRRMRWIGAALAPLKGELTPTEHRRLRMALALVFGTNAMVTLRDICGLSPREAQRVSAWAADALVMAAVEQHGRVRRARTVGRGSARGQRRGRPKTRKRS